MITFRTQNLAAIYGAREEGLLLQAASSSTPRNKAFLNKAQAHLREVSKKRPLTNQPSG